MSIKDWATHLLSQKRRASVDTTEPTTEQQYRKVLEDAEDFDRLVVMPGWEKACKFLITEVQNAIAEATQYKYEKEKMTDLVVRWDSKREQLDGLMAYIGGMQQERDRLVAMYKGEKQNG